MDPSIANAHDMTTKEDEIQCNQWMRKRKINISLQSMMNVFHELESENRDLRNKYLEKTKKYEEQQLALCKTQQLSGKNSTGCEEIAFKANELMKVRIK